MIKKILKKILKPLLKTIYRNKKRKSLYNINVKYAGKFSSKAFLIKSNSLKNLGHNIGDNLRIVGPFFCSAKLHIGNNVFIGRNVCFEGDGNIYIGDNVDIAPNVVINTGGHLVGSSERRAGVGLTTTVKIGNGTWIGNSSLIFNEVSIGTGNVIAAGSVVRCSTIDNVLVAGVPAIVKKHLI